MSIYFSPPPNYRVPGGLIGDGVADDAPAINALLATGRTAFLPRPSVRYRLGSPLILSSTIGQRLIGEDQGTEIRPDSGIDAIHLGARSQQIENLNIRCISGKGIVIPLAIAYWKVLYCLISFASVAVENKVVDPAPGAPQGSDAGLIHACQITTCTVGYLAFGNKDYTMIDGGTSIGSCGIAVKIDGDGGVRSQGGVYGGNGTAILVQEGRFCGGGMSFELNTDFDVYVNTNAAATIESSFTTAPPTPNVQAQANATIDFFGYCGGFNSARSNGTGLIHNFGGRQVIVIDYNGAFSFPAGPYDYVSDGDGLPVSAAQYVGREMAVVGANAVSFYKCLKTGASAYRWVGGNPVVDGTYTTGLGVGQNGTETFTNGIITAIQEATA